MKTADAPLGILLELTHRCPLQCPYCSNPLALKRSADELSTEVWLKALDEAAALGVLQVHFSGGEPLLRQDLVSLVRRSRERQMYSNLITSGVNLDRRKLDELATAGLDHVQISFQDAEAGNADQIAGLSGAHAKKMVAAAMVVEAGVALTLNFVVHRGNAENVGRMIGLAAEVGAGRVEIAHAQYHGWALLNRRALLPTREQLDAVTREVEGARAQFRGKLVIDYVVPDYYAVRPKACMGGWGRRVLTISPDGKVLPCHAADTIPDLQCPSIHESSLGDIWNHSPAFQRFRGTAWMPDPCRTCDRREVDWGGCRCQALALTGAADQTDPACALSPHHQRLVEARLDSGRPPPSLIYRRMNRKKSEESAAVLPR